MPGRASYDPATKQYTTNSAGYNIWYTRDEFRYLKKMSGDVSIAADIAYPETDGYGDRKASWSFARIWTMIRKGASPPCTVPA